MRYSINAHRIKVNEQTSGYIKHFSLGNRYNHLFFPVQWGLIFYISIFYNYCMLFENFFTFITLKERRTHLDHDRYYSLAFRTPSHLLLHAQPQVLPILVKQLVSPTNDYFSVMRSLLGPLRPLPVLHLKGTATSLQP